MLITAEPSFQLISVFYDTFSPTGEYFPDVSFFKLWDMYLVLNIKFRVWREGSVVKNTRT